MDTQQFLDNLKRICPELNLKLIEKTAEFAQEAYQGLNRFSGQPYLEHCFEVALDLAKMKLDTTTVAAAVLHETMDKAKISQDRLIKEFGPEIAFLVEGMTKVTQIKAKKTKKNADNFRKLFLAMAKDIRVILIKLVNQLHNLKTLHIFDTDDQKRIAQQILEIYAPIAERLGIGEIKGQLEDLAFSYAYPEKYQDIINQLEEKREQNERYIKEVIPLVEKNLKQRKVKFNEIQARAKHYYSIYKKLLKHHNDWTRIYDLVALRILASDIENCYAALGVIHENWRPLIKRFDDYIAVPKLNGYQSLHTDVFCEKGKIVEFQIRTPKMHKQAELGIAAHFHYNQTKNADEALRSQKKLQKELVWVKQLREWQKQKFSSGQEFFNALKIDFLNDRIFTFTPKGDVIDLPEDATALDFAYHVHTELGDQCVAAKIDGKFSAVSTPLQNGQVIEIVTEKNKKPNSDWLKFVKTHQAKNRIKTWLKKNK